MFQSAQTGLKSAIDALSLTIKVRRFSLGGCLLTLSLSMPVALAPAQGQLFDSPVDKLPVAERVTLRKGEPIITGSDGKYLGKVLVTASTDLVWSVLTDYNDFSRFLPNVASSRILESQGNHKVVEQVDVRQVFLINTRSRLRSDITETNKTRIDFRLIEGDLQKLQGYWQIEPVAPYRGAAAQQVLITQLIEAQPNPGTPQGIFNSIFKDSFKKNLAAVSQEVSRRVQSASR